MSERKRRHRWAREQQRGETCARCGVTRYYVSGDDSSAPTFNYEWPDGRKEARSVNSGYVPPCEPNKKTDKGDRK